MGERMVTQENNIQRMYMKRDQRNEIYFFFLKKIKAPLEKRFNHERKKGL